VGFHSLDGKTLYFTKEQGGALWGVPAGGGAEFMVLDRGAARNVVPAADGIYFMQRDAEGHSFRFLDYATRPGENIRLDDAESITASACRRTVAGLPTCRRIRSEAIWCWWRTSGSTTHWAACSASRTLRARSTRSNSAMSTPAYVRSACAPARSSRRAGCSRSVAAIRTRRPAAASSSGVTRSGRTTYCENNDCRAECVLTSIPRLSRTADAMWNTP
jgi:hypothetical protein